METTITKSKLTETKDRFEVRTDTGYFAGFGTMDEAAAHANGLQAGYNAAVAKLGRAQAFRNEVR